MPVQAAFAGSQAQLAIGVITYNRLKLLKPTLAALTRYTKTPFDLFVADDGSSDGTAGFLARENIAHHTSRNRGIAWNKNRALYYLAHASAAPILMLLEDDTYPTIDNWERDWIEAANLWGHCNMAFGGGNDHALSGSGTPQDPILTRALAGQCQVFTRKAMDTVGYFDSRFIGYGVEHIEHTKRMVKAGFGGICTQTENGPDFIYKLIESRMRLAQDFSTADPQTIAYNTQLEKEIANDPIYRWPWHNQETQAIFLAEMAQSGLQVPTRDPPPSDKPKPSSPFHVFKKRIFGS